MNVMIYFFNDIKCEICQQSYPLKINYEGKEISLVNIEFEKNKRYALFEIYEKYFHKIKGIMIIFFES